MILIIVYCKIRPPLHDNTHWHCRVPRPSLCSLSCLEDLALASAVGLYLTIRNIWHQEAIDQDIHQLMCQYIKPRVITY